MYVRPCILGYARSAYKHTHNPQFLHSLWRKTNSRNFIFETLHGGQYTLSIQMIILNYPMKCLTGLQSSSWRWRPWQYEDRGGMIKRKRGKCPLSSLFEGFIIAYYTFLNLTELIFGSLHNNEFCITMSQNIGMKATEQRVSVAVFITKKVCYAPWS